MVHLGYRYMAKIYSFIDTTCKTKPKSIPQTPIELLLLLSCERAQSTAAQPPLYQSLEKGGYHGRVPTTTGWAFCCNPKDIKSTLQVWTQNLSVIGWRIMESTCSTDSGNHNQTKSTKNKRTVKVAQRYFLDNKRICARMLTNGIQSCTRQSGHVCAHLVDKDRKM